MSSAGASGGDRPITVLIAAMGGEGGGVLAGWITKAAVASGFHAQRTSIPGVAQRTGATTYYIEILPTQVRAGAPKPVMALNPAPGGIDLMVATELLEAGRAMHGGFVTPDRTTLVASTHRIFSIDEKSGMGDGRFDTDRVFVAAKRLARDAVMFDMAAVGQEVGAHINSVILGAMAASGRLPIDPAVLVAVIRDEGKAVESNLRGFQAGIEAVEAGSVAKMAAIAKRRAPRRALDQLMNVLASTFPEPTHELLGEGIARTTDYQDPKYAALYLDRLKPILTIDDGGPARDYRLTAETGRHLAVWMTFEDTIRVAQLKMRQSRLDRVRAEVRAKATEPVHVTEFMKPGPEELFGLLPPKTARRILGWVERKGLGQRLTFPMKVRTTTVMGFGRLWVLSRLRRWRPRSWRWAEEQALIEQWLDLVRRAGEIDRSLGLEVAQLARLVKGYGETNKRGRANFLAIVEAVAEPAVAGAMPVDRAVDALIQARMAALADPEGQRLARTLEALRRIDEDRVAAE